MWLVNSNFAHDFKVVELCGEWELAWPLVIRKQPCGKNNAGRMWSESAREQVKLVTGSCPEQSPVIAHIRLRDIKKANWTQCELWACPVACVKSLSVVGNVWLLGWWLWCCSTEVLVTCVTVVLGCVALTSFWCCTVSGSQSNYLWECVFLKSRKV